MNSKMSRTSRNSERGTQLLELAIVLPLLVFLASLVSEGADFIRVHQVLNNAAREGAKFSSMPENSCATAPVPATCIAAIQSAVVNYANNNHVTITTANVDVNQQAAWVVPAGTTKGFWVSQVTVSYSYPIAYLKMAPGFIPANQTSILLRGIAQFQNFYGN
jgi:Flp pilus assembly protein TadG